MVRAQLFASCMVDLFRPRAGIAAVQVLERRGVDLEFPVGQTCCGQFAFNAGHHREAAAMGRQLVKAFESSSGEQTAAVPVVALSGSCTAMVKHEMPTLLERDAMSRGGDRSSAGRWRGRAEALADRMIEFTQWLDRTEPGRADTLGVRPGGQPGIQVALHTGCHMRRLLRQAEPQVNAIRRSGAAPVELHDAEQCCGFGGSFGLLEPQVSAAMADAKLASLEAARQDGATCLASPDLGCLMHLGGRLARRGDAFPVIHIAEIVDLADQGRLSVEGIRAAASLQDRID